MDSAGKSWVCPAQHSFDIAKEGYVNLLLSRGGQGRQPGDSKEMVDARRRFLASGSYDPMTAAVARVVAEVGPEVVLDVGCGEGHHSAAVPAPVFLGLDLSKPAVAIAARSDRRGRYAVASAADIPLGDGSVDLVLNIFGPIFAEELARVLRPGGLVVSAHPGPTHLTQLRAMVYQEPRPHRVKPPLRNAGSQFQQVSSREVRFSFPVDDLPRLRDLFAMTPYRWHAGRDIETRMSQAVAQGLTVTGDVRVTVDRRVADG